MLFLEGLCEGGRCVQMDHHAVRCAPLCDATTVSTPALLAIAFQQKLLCRQQSVNFLRVMHSRDAKLTGKLGAAIDFVAWRDGAGRDAWQATLAHVDAPLPPAPEPPAA